MARGSCPRGRFFAEPTRSETIADRLAAEVFAGDGWAEVGYDQGRRIRLRTIESPLDHSSFDFRAEAR